MPCHDPIPFGDDVIREDPEIGQRPVGRLQRSLDAFWPRSLVRGRIMVHGVGSDKLINNGWIPSVQHLVNETANESLIQFQHGICSTWMCQLY